MSEIDEALSLVWEVFLEFEAPDYSEEGIRTFETTIIKSVDFKNRILSGDQLMYGAFHDKKLIGVLSVVYVIIYRYYLYIKIIIERVLQPHSLKNYLLNLVKMRLKRLP